MKSCKITLCAMVLLAFLTVGLSGCCSTMNYGRGGGWFGTEPQNQGARTVEEFMRQSRPGENLTTVQ
ncbi:MAG: hypothetical protein PVH19_13225 [Planctomycetia bacterium]|jgi:hypothetical protein